MSQRKRAPRGSLNPEKIVEAALTIADREGLAALTVRKLATAMGASPMAIYGHFANKGEIVGQLLGQVIERFEVTAHEGEGRVWVVECFRRMRIALLSHPGVIPLLGMPGSISTESLRVMEALVYELARWAGSDGAAASAFYTMLTFTVGSVHVEQGMRHALEGGVLDADHTLYEALSSSEGETLLRMAPVFLGQASEGPFLEALDRLCPR